MANAGSMPPLEGFAIESADAPSVVLAATGMHKDGSPALSPSRVGRGVTVGPGVGATDGSELGAELTDGALETDGESEGSALIEG